MSPTAFDITGRRAILKGLPWSFRFTRLGPDKQPIDLTGCSARLQIFDALASRSAPPLVTLTSAGGEIALGGAAGTVAITLGDVSGGFAAKNLRYRLYFTDSLGDEDLYFYGRLGLRDGEW
jgi:hypothetical protein